MKVLIAGDWHSELHEEAVYGALMALGQDVVKFPWCGYFRSTSRLRSVLQPLTRLQAKYMCGPVVDRLNNALVDSARAHRPEVVLIYRGSHVYPGTLRRLRLAAPGCAVVGYNNDDPFSTSYPRWAWRHFLAGLPEYDLVLAYRHHNLDDYRRLGAQKVELLRSWYMTERNYPVDLSTADQARYGCDVTFVGHYEDDGRVEYLREVVRAGAQLRVWGPGYEWDTVLRRIPELRSQVPVTLVWGEEYNKALAGARIALCFLSKLNRDTYTRRCFEIPATGTLLLSEYSEDLASLFDEGVEAEFFRSQEELRRKVAHYLGAGDSAREAIAEQGRLRVARDGHDVVSRMRQLLRWIDELRAAQVPLPSLARS